MHIECEKGSSPLPGTDRARSPSRPSRRGLPAGLPDARASSRPKDRSATHGPSAQGRSSPVEALTLEHVLVAAKRRRAPVSAQTAGYIALGVADALVAAPAVVQPAHVQVTPEGDVLLRGAIGRGDEQAAEQAVRALLARLLSVAVGASPALAAAAHRSSFHGLEAVIGEIEAALVPVNRAAARRTIGRLAREVTRAGIRLPEKRRTADPRPAVPTSPGKRVKPSEPVPAPPVEPVDREPVELQTVAPVEPTLLPEPAILPATLALEDATDIDAPVAPVVIALPNKALAAPAPCAQPCAAFDDAAQAGPEATLEEGWLLAPDDGGLPVEEASGTSLEGKADAVCDAVSSEDAFEWEGDIVLHATAPPPRPRRCQGRTPA